MSLPKLTGMEYRVLQGMYRSEYHDGGERAWIWAWAIRADDVPATSIPGVVASLNKKGVVRSEGSGDEASIYVTDLGVQVARELGLI